MILDDRALFSDDQDLSGGSDLSDSSYDLGAPGKTYDGAQLLRRMGVAGMIPLMCQVTEDFTVGGGFTDLDIQLQASDTVDGAGDINGTIETIFSVNVLLADLVAGYQIPIDKLPRKVTKRYLQFNYVANGAAPGAGKISAGFVAAVDGMNKSGF